jgi:hypothetical protein
MTMTSTPQAVTIRPRLDIDLAFRLFGLRLDLIAEKLDRRAEMGELTRRVVQLEEAATR